ncbi:hypothetical protein DES36_1264 [Alkalibaculum bacchi]|uniref:Uncharacterized protein n=1 Tax=Alkalibaculum bacchi TaxID=645887 RepID=A0A366HZK1_9FIRM|nr:hypothetical protein [Alkalibaculum bacchi]RBP57935.1 hypothetical protein DES36_1264 [Alkalibaculum bacchi]
MKEKLLAMNKTDFMNKEPIYFDNIQCGFDDYHYMTLHGSEFRYKTFLKKALDLNGSDHVYVDFYYGRLEQKEKENLQSFLTQEDLQVLDFIDYDNGIYFHLTEEILPFLIKITAQEILFSTFYFTKIPCTLWGNYELKFPIFFKDTQAKRIYEELALSCGLRTLNNR